MDTINILASSKVSIVLACFQSIKEAQDEYFKHAFCKKNKVNGRASTIRNRSFDLVMGDVVDYYNFIGSYEGLVRQKTKWVSYLD